MKVIVCRVGQSPAVEDIGSDLKDMQEIVDGWLEVVMVERDLGLYMNEEGRLRGFPYNRLVEDDHGNLWDVHGNIFLSRHDYAGDNVSLTEADIAKWLPRLESR